MWQNSTSSSSVGTPSPSQMHSVINSATSEWVNGSFIIQLSCILPHLFPIRILAIYLIAPFLPVAPLPSDFLLKKAARIYVSVDAHSRGRFMPSVNLAFLKVTRQRVYGDVLFHSFQFSGQDRIRTCISIQLSKVVTNYYHLTLCPSSRAAISCASVLRLQTSLKVLSNIL